VATDAQGRQLSEDGYYYWDGTAWQPVQDDSAAQGTSTSNLDEFWRAPSEVAYNSLTDEQKQAVTKTPSTGQSVADSSSAEHQAPVVEDA
jgi:hypothetical protein